MRTSQYQTPTPEGTTGRYLRPTPLLDFGHPSIQSLVHERGWAELPTSERIGAIYDLVRNTVPFGYNAADDIPASSVLADGYGQCNTKSTLLMALLRATGVPCRFHGATIDKRLQHGIISGLFYRVAPRDIIHSWVEVSFDDRWVGLEGVILDDPYLDGIRAMVGTPAGGLLGHAVGTEDLANPPVAWHGTDTKIQATGVNHDFGPFDDPDGFYAGHPGNVRGLKGWLFRTRMRRLMNARVAAVRAHAAVHKPAA